MPSLQDLPDKLSATAAGSERETLEGLKDWKTDAIAEGANDLFNRFSGVNDDSVISVEGLQTFLTDHGGAAGIFEDELQDQLNNLISNDINERKTAEKQVQAFIHYLKLRNKVVLSSQRDLRKFRAEQPESAPMLTMLYEKGTGLGGTLAESFMEADLKDKAVMLAGVYLSYLMVKGAWKRMFGKDDNQPHIVKDVAGVLVGGFGIYLAAEAVNKSYEKTAGVPLFNSSNSRNPFKGSNFAALKGGQSAEDRKKFLVGLEADQAVVQLKSSNFSADIFKGTRGAPDYDEEHEKKKFVYALGNIGTLSLEEYVILYDKGFKAKSVANEDPYPSRPFSDDKLSTGERFNVLEDVGLALGILKTPGDYGDIKDKNWKERKGSSIIHLSLDKVL